MYAPPVRVALGDESRSYLDKAFQIRHLPRYGISPDKAFWLAVDIGFAFWLAIDIGFAFWLAVDIGFAFWLAVDIETTAARQIQAAPPAPPYYPFPRGKPILG